MEIWECGKHLYSDFVFTINGNMEKLEDTTYGTCKIDSKNRITLPPKAMNFLKLTAGELVSIEKNNGNLCLLKAYIYVKRNNNCKKGENGDGSANSN